MFAPFRSKAAFVTALLTVLAGASHTDTIIGLVEGTSGSARLLKAFLMEIPQIPGWIVWVSAFYSASFLGLELIDRRGRVAAAPLGVDSDRSTEEPVTTGSQGPSPVLKRPAGPSSPDLADRVRRRILAQHQHDNVRPAQWRDMAHKFKVFKEEIDAFYRAYEGVPWKNAWTLKPAAGKPNSPVDIKDFYAVAIRAGALIQEAAGFPLMPRMGNSLDQVWLNVLSDFFDLEATHAENGIRVSQGVFPDIAGHSILLLVQLENDPTQLEDLRWRVKNIVEPPK